MTNSSTVTTYVICNKLVNLQFTGYFILNNKLEIDIIFSIDCGI